MDLPEFRFNRRAYDEGNFAEAAGTCDFCRLDDQLIYKGGIYVPEPEPTVCVHCIADGRLAEPYGSDHALFGDFEMGDAEPELREEVFVRTPGVPNFNPFEWPVMDGKPMAFVGYGEDENLWSDPSARAAMEDAWLRDMGEVLNGPTPYLLVFQQVDGSAWRAEIDLD